MRPSLPSRRISKKRRNGVSLLEIMVVIVLLGVFSAVAIGRFGRTIFGATGAETHAHKLALAMNYAKRRAITTGADHALVFQSSSTGSSYSVVDLAVNQVVDGPYNIDPEVSVKTSDSSMGFTFEGKSNGAYWIELYGSKRVWRIDITPITAAVNLSDRTAS